MLVYWRVRMLQLKDINWKSVETTVHVFAKTDGQQYFIIIPQRKYHLSHPTPPHPLISVPKICSCIHLLPPWPPPADLTTWPRFVLWWRHLTISLLLWWFLYWQLHLARPWTAALPFWVFIDHLSYLFLIWRPPWYAAIRQSNHRFLCTRLLAPQ